MAGLDFETTSTDSSSVIPFISQTNNIQLKINTSKEVILDVLGVTPNAAVEIPNFTGSIDLFEVLSPTQLKLVITTNNTKGVYDIVINNAGVKNTLWENNGVGLFIVKEFTWMDFSTNGESITHGNAAGNDIRYKSGMTLKRDAAGMWFEGVSIWSCWMKVEKLAWNRGENKTYQMILTSSNTRMVGFAGDDTNEGSGSQQYWEAEVNVHFDNSNNIWGLYGKTLSNSHWNQSASKSYSSGDVLKLKFENDGQEGSVLRIYKLPSADPSDWDDESNLFHSITIPATANHDSDRIMPFAIPNSGNSGRFIAAKVG